MLLEYQSAMPPADEEPISDLGCFFVLFATFCIPVLLISGSFLIERLVRSGGSLGDGLANVMLIVVTLPCTIFGLMALFLARSVRHKRVVMVLLMTIVLMVATAIVSTFIH